MAVPSATPTLAVGQREVIENGRRYIADTKRGMLVDPETGRDMRPLRPDELAAPASPAAPADAAASQPPDQEQPTVPPEQPPSAATPAAPDAAQTPAGEPPDEEPNAPTPPAQPPPAQQTPGAEEPPRPPGEPPATPAGTPLTIPENAVQEGSTDFLNGRWRSITGVPMTRAIRSSSTMSSKMAGNGELAEIGRQHPTRLLGQGGVESGQASSESIRRTRCPDGVTFQDSSVECSVGEGGKAVCQGSNADGTKYDVSIVK